MLALPLGIEPGPDPIEKIWKKVIFDFVSGTTLGTAGSTYEPEKLKLNRTKVTYFMCNTFKNLN